MRHSHDFHPMNLYDKDDGFRVFRLDEANALLPEIITATEEALIELEETREQRRNEGLEDQADEYDEETAEILQKWSAAMVKLGVYPKGFFTVDFKSYVPDTLLCWTYGEQEVGFTHKIYENFKDRAVIKDKRLLGFEGSIN
jgi:hypothetical protein